jgi:hypothetical protein
MPIHTIGRRCYLIRIGVTNNEGKKEKKMMKHNKKQEQQKHSTTSNNNSFWCITTDRYMCVRLFRGAGCLVIVMMIFFFLFFILIIFNFVRSARRYFLHDVEGRIWKKRRTKYNSRERVSIALDWKSNLIASHAKPLTERTPGCSDVSNNNTNGHPKKFGWKKAAMKKKKKNR